MSIRRLPLLALLASTPLGALWGCAADGVAGYSLGQTYDEDVRTIAVPIFDNRSFDRELEFQLTEALIKRIEQETPYKVTHEAGADTILSGTILSVDRRLLSRDFDTALPQEQLLEVTASFEWKDLRTGQVRRQRSRIRGAGEYIPSRGVGEPVEVARLAAVDDLSRQILSVMRSDW